MNEKLLLASERTFMTRYPGGFENEEMKVIGKLAKWSLMTIIPVYYRLDEEIFVKPTTTKNVIRIFELEDIQYKPRPSYEFYKKYKACILQMKSKVNPLVAVNNPAFTGFLMLTMDEEKE